jgi:hypothetical protein
MPPQYPIRDIYRPFGTFNAWSSVVVGAVPTNPSVDVRGVVQQFLAKVHGDEHYTSPSGEKGYFGTIRWSSHRPCIGVVNTVMELPSANNVLGPLTDHPDIRDVGAFASEKQAIAYFANAP